MTQMAEPAWVWVDGSRLTPWMAYQVARLDADFYKRWGVHIKVTSGIRTCAEQERIFRDRYVTAGNINGRKVYDTRVWNGVRWYRISPLGTVAVPCTSNHNINGTSGAYDLRDTGSDPGITRAGTPRANWLRANAHKYDMVPEGYNFSEPWHYKALNIFKTPPSSGGGGGSTPGKGTVVNHYQRQDATARSAGRVLTKGQAFWLNINKGASPSKASNIVGGVGPYSFAVHIYAEGTPGDVVEVVLAWDNTKTSGPHSFHYVERVTIDRDGQAKASFPFLRAVSSGYAVYARAMADADNKGNVKVTVFDTDAYLFN